MKYIDIPFKTGNTEGTRFDSINLAPTRDGRVSYSQNIVWDSNLMPAGIPIPGPAYSLTSVTSSGEVTAKCYAFAAGTPTYYYALTSAGSSTLYSSTNGLTPLTSIATLTNGISKDLVMVNKPNGGGTYKAFLISMTDYSGNVKIDFYNVSDATGPQQLLNIGASLVANVLVGQDDNVYYSANNFVYMANMTNIASITQTQIITLPYIYRIKALARWNNYMAIIATKTGEDFTIFLWDYISTTYNSVSTPIGGNTLIELVNDLSGNLYLLVREGIVADGSAEYNIYAFSGYGFDKIYTFNDAPPSYNNNGKFQSIGLDAKGNFIWVTDTGAIMRYSRVLKTIANITSPASGFPPTVRNVILISGDNNIITSQHRAAADSLIETIVNTSVTSYTSPSLSTSQMPLLISGQQNLPKKSVIREIRTSIKKAVTYGRTIELRKYYLDAAGAIQYTVLDTFSEDATLQSDFITRLCDYNVSDFAIGYFFAQGTINTADTSVQPQALLECTLGFQPLSIF